MFFWPLLFLVDLPRFLVLDFRHRHHCHQLNLLR
jgi:hypothetical protein